MGSVPRDNVRGRYSLSNPEVTRSVLREGEGECACSPAGAARDPQECQGCLTEVTK